MSEDLKDVKGTLKFEQYNIKFYQFIYRDIIVGTAFYYPLSWGCQKLLLFGLEGKKNYFLWEQ